MDTACSAKPLGLPGYDGPFYPDSLPRLAAAYAALPLLSISTLAALANSLAPDLQGEVYDGLISLDERFWSSAVVFDLDHERIALLFPQHRDLAHGTASVEVYADGEPSDELMTWLLNALSEALENEWQSRRQHSRRWRTPRSQPFI